MSESADITIILKPEQVGRLKIVQLERLQETGSSPTINELIGELIDGKLRLPEQKWPSEFE